MALQVQPVTLEDFSTIALLTDDSKGSLADPPLFDCWPVANTTESLRRSAWSAAQNAWRLTNDPTVRFVKVIDTTKDNEIISIARWHYYPNGFPQENTWMEIDVFAPPAVEPNFPPGMDGNSLVDFLREATAQRAEWELTTKACWILTILVTRSGFRRMGAGGMLVDWGAKEAQKMGVVACLEADPDAVGLYAKHGFEKWLSDDDGGTLGLIRMYKKPT